MCIMCLWPQPANVLLDAEGHIQLADLGLAVFLTSRATAAVERRHTFGCKYPVLWMCDSIVALLHSVVSAAKVVPKFGIRGRAGTPGWYLVNQSIHCLSTLHVALCGRAGFWAPEMLGTDEFGKAPEYTSAVDFYSLGAFLFNLLAGKWVLQSSRCLLLLFMIVRSAQSSTGARDASW